MKKTIGTGLIALMLTAVAAGQRGAEHTWTVYSDVPLDERIERQLNVLAGQDQALLNVAKTPAAARSVSTLGNLTLELHLEPKSEVFLDTLKRGAPSAAIPPNADVAGDGYVIEVNYPRAVVPNRIRITANTPRGFHNALLRIPDLLAMAPANLSSSLIPHPQAVRVERNGVSVTLVDFPSFPERGIVEGFYGTPWTHQDRVEMLRFEGNHGMNVYYYAPKDDPYHRKLWREPYPVEAQQKLGELVTAARRNFVDFCYAISPGLSIVYSNEGDFQTLTNKLASVGRLGVSCFALFLDDVPQDFQDAQDKAQFKTLARAHVYLTNKLYKQLKEQSAANRLVLTPTTYTNEWGSRDYIQELGEGVDPAVSIVWTGPKVLSPAITVEDSRAWGALLHRPPLIWDNFPVNDGTPWCRYLGPLVNRDAHLPEVTRGFFANPMIQPHLSLIPLQTVADYLWNSVAYEPAKSENHALVSRYGESAPRQLAPFLNVYSTYYWDDGNFTPLFRERRKPIDVAKMQSQLETMRSALESLRNVRRLQPLLDEIAPAIKRTTERLTEVKADPAFQHLPAGTLQWNENYEALSAYHVAQSPNLDGDFAKWEAGSVYRLDESAQLVAGARLWRGPQEFSARVALAWDASYLYIGVDVVDAKIFQPFFARGIQNGDSVRMTLETGFRKNFFAHEPTGDEYSFYFSPGNFADVKPSIFSDDDILPPRPQPHNYMTEIFTAWKKTSNGYSGDIAIPVTYFEGGKLAAGYEIGLAFGAAKVFPPTKPTDPDDLERIVFRSKKDHLFSASSRNPSSIPRLVLAEGKQ